MKFLFLTVITLGLYPVFLVLKAVGRSITGSGPKHKKHELILVSLNKAQIARARKANGKRKQITHALLCGPYGQIFSTEKQCLKYYLVWRDIFSGFVLGEHRNDELRDSGIPLYLRLGQHAD